MKTVSEFLAGWKVYGDDKEFVAELETFQCEAYEAGRLLQSSCCAGDRGYA